MIAPPSIPNWITLKSSTGVNRFDRLERGASVGEPADSATRNEHTALKTVLIEILNSESHATDSGLAKSAQSVT